tara:strand:- start:226 stop:495 length:270 start_codon:yes stop_codon:yes gene_type:complete
MEIRRTWFHIQHQNRNTGLLSEIPIQIMLQRFAQKTGDPGLILLPTLIVCALSGFCYTRHAEAQFKYSTGRLTAYFKWELLSSDIRKHL